IITRENVIDDGDVLIESGLISSVSSSRLAESIHSSIDLDGLTLFPGFIDIHIHGAAGVDTMDATADDLRRVGEFLSARGVTAWLPTLVPAPPKQYQQAIDSIEGAMQTRGKDAQVLG